MNLQKINTRYYLYIIGSIILLTALILTLNNIKLRRALKHLQSPSYNIDLDEQIKSVTKNNTNVRIIRNSEKGLWDKEGQINIKLIHELTIGGEEESDPNKNFYRAFPVMADEDGNIYVAEVWTEGTIKKFDSNGNYLLTFGRKGAGPGEFSGFISIFFSQDKYMFIFDQGAQRINKFTLNGKFLDSFLLEDKYASSQFSGFVMDNLKNFYLSFFDIETNKVIHKYNSEARYVKSFGHTVSLKGPETFISRSMKMNNSRGRMVVNENRLFYSQRNPYEIRIYELDGSLKSVIFRKNSFMPSDKVEISGNDSYIFTIPAHSTLIGIWNEMIINCVWMPIYMSNTTGTVIDIFNLKGELLTSLRLKDSIYFSHIDQYGKLYGHTGEESDRIMRFALRFESK